ncbi:cytochrome P450 [Streptosporangium carneum]|uniref:Cytochrome P450 n=1 Tax=Streptosporangium carneum TaxID=47481 RepID=A0A9W6I0V0_9ACTN|nr:cytochrome P450 [Streptosporangium carneum]GLK09618.1 cytochrome P450 [Streptosporangium carneum]
MPNATPAPIPAQRPNHFDPPTALARLRESAPVSPLAYPDGHTGWLVTSHALVRAVLADPRFSARAELNHLPIPRPALTGGPQPAPPGVFSRMDPPDHTRYRHLLTGQFTVRRMRGLTARVQQITAEHLDAMERHGPPVDLVQSFALPIPALVICELLGVPYADREHFQRHSAALMRLDNSPQEMVAAYTTMQGFMRELVLAKRAEPTDDLLSGLTGADLTDEELTSIGFVLLGAGFETTANMLALGALVLMEHPGQLAVLRAGPDAAGQAVEELLRYLSVIPFTTRTALEDVELDGRPVRAGETVTVSIPAANRDPSRFADPDILDLLRPGGGHLAFGHGVHQCLGQQLARVEMQVGYPALFDRFPTLRLAVDLEEVPFRDDMIIYGVHRLPVTWDAS